MWIKKERWDMLMTSNQLLANNVELLSSRLWDQNREVDALRRAINNAAMGQNSNHVLLDAKLNRLASNDRNAEMMLETILMVSQKTRWSTRAYDAYVRWESCAVGAITAPLRWYRKRRAAKIAAMFAVYNGPRQHDADSKLPNNFIPPL